MNSVISSQRANFYTFAIFSILAGFTALILSGIIVPSAYAIALIICFPMGESIVDFFKARRFDTDYKLKKAFPHCGFTTTKVSKSDNNNTVMYEGSYRGFDFLIHACKGDPLVNIYHRIFTFDKENYPDRAKLLDTINRVNCSAYPCRIIMLGPDQHGDIDISVFACTMLPESRNFLGYILCALLSLQALFLEEYRKVLTYNQRTERGPVGFTPPNREVHFDPTTFTDDTQADDNECYNEPNDVGEE